MVDELLNIKRKDSPRSTGSCASSSSFSNVTRIKIEVDSKFITGANDTGNRLKQITEREAEVDPTSSAASTSLRTVNDKPMDISVLMKEEDLGTCFEEAESNQFDPDFSASCGDKKDASCGDNVLAETEMNRGAAEFAGIESNAPKPVLPLSVVFEHVCTLCCASFAKETNLKYHMRIHSNKKPFVCTHCPARYNDKSVLKRHMRLHSNGKLLACPFCPATYYREGDLKKHLHMHSSAIQFVCTLCPAHFNHNYDLKRHLLSHSNETIYS